MIKLPKEKRPFSNDKSFPLLINTELAAQKCTIHEGVCPQLHGEPSNLSLEGSRTGTLFGIGDSWGRNKKGVCQNQVNFLHIFCTVQVTSGSDSTGVSSFKLFKSIGISLCLASKLSAIIKCIYKATACQLKRIRRCREESCGSIMAHSFPTCIIPHPHSDCLES